METKNCNTCSEEIKYDAKKCTHCDTFQNWRRHLDFGKNFLALVIAFISVVTVLVTQLKSASEKDFSNAYVESFIMNRNGVSLITSNTGNVPAYIKSCKLYFTDNDSIVLTYNLTLDDNTNTSRIIEAEKSSEIFFEINRDWLRESMCKYINQSRDILYEGDRFKGIIRYEVVNYDSKQKRINKYSNGENVFLIKDLIHALQYDNGGFDCIAFINDQQSSI